MSKPYPKVIKINHDFYAAKFIGRTANKRQFFLTNPFVPATRGSSDSGREFIALYLFDSGGNFLEAKIDDLGPREKVDENYARSIIKKRLDELGNVWFGNIKIAPFRVEKFGVEFGLIPQPPEESDGDWLIIVEPGNYMCFYPPWNGGYDT